MNIRKMILTRVVASQLVALEPPEKEAPGSLRFVAQEVIVAFVGMQANLASGAEISGLAVDRLYA